MICILSQIEIEDFDPDAFLSMPLFDAANAQVNPVK